jgi:hypothetical protein
MHIRTWNRVSLEMDITRMSLSRYSGGTPDVLIYRL